MNRNQHTAEFREQAVSKVRERGTSSVREIAEELNNSAGTLRNWWANSNRDRLPTTPLDRRMPCRVPSSMRGIERGASSSIS